MKILKSLSIALLVLIVSVGIVKACYIPTPTCEELQNCEVTPTPTEVTPEVTVTPEVQGEAGDIPSNPSTNTTSAPLNLCNGIYPEAPIIRVEQYKKTSDTSAHFGFWPVKADSYIVQYGYSKDHLDYGIPYLGGDSTGFEVSNLKPGFSYLYARVIAKSGECYTASDVAN